MTAEEFATAVAATFGTQPSRHGREFRVFCPHHEADGGTHRPSLAVWSTDTDRYAYKCMTGCSSSSVRAALRDRGVSVGRGTALTHEQQVQAARTREGRRVEQLIKARDCLYAASRVERGDAVDLYLRSRAIDILPLGVTSLRCGEDPSRVGGVAMLGVICDLTSAKSGSVVLSATGITSLSLNSDGSPRLGPDGKKFRSIVGTSKGMAVPLGEPGRRLVVGEGIETTLAAMILLDVPFGAATLSASNMPDLAVPEWVRDVYIATDNDPAGIDASIRLAEALFAAGVPSRRRMWGTTGWDAADELRRLRGLVVEGTS